MLKTDGFESRALTPGGGAGALCEAIADLRSVPHLPFSTLKRQPDIANVPYKFDVTTVYRSIQANCAVGCRDHTKGKEPSGVPISSMLGDEREPLRLGEALDGGALGFEP
jgi:hypothetical protein